MPDKKTDPETTSPAEADSDSKALIGTHGAIESNHNSSHPVDPVRTANLIGKPDYNPMRTAGNRANDKSDTTLVPETAAKLVDEKGDRPTAAEAAMKGRTMTGETVKPSANDFVMSGDGTMIRGDDKRLLHDIEDRDASMLDASTESAS